MPLPDGGLLDRLVEESIHRMVRDALDTLGWFDDTETEGGSRRGYTRHVELIPEPLPAAATVEPNTAVLDLETIDDDDYECGNAQPTSRRFLGYVDFYAENRSVGGHLAGDVAAILRGDHAAAGRTSPNVAVIDWSSAGLEQLTYAIIEHVRLDRGRNPTSSWTGLFYSVQFEVIVDND